MCESSKLPAQLLSAASMISRLCVILLIAPGEIVTLVARLALRAVDTSCHLLHICCLIPRAPGCPAMLNLNESRQAAHQIQQWADLFHSDAEPYEDELVSNDMTVPLVLMLAFASARTGNAWALKAGLCLALCLLSMPACPLIWSVEGCPHVLRRLLMSSCRTLE